MTENFYEGLIQKRLANTLTETESNALSEWMAASEENRLAVEEAEIVWQTSANLAAAPDIDLDAEFSLLENRIEADEQAEKREGTPVIPLAPANSQPIYKPFPWKMVMGIAAGLLIFVLIGIYGIPLLSQPPTQEWAEFTTHEHPHPITLADGTTITLNKESHLKYPKGEIVGERSVELEGEAFFEVAKDPEHPFSVQTNQSKITVLGTSFNVKAHSAQDLSSVQVVTGKVKFASLDDQQSLELTPGEQGVYSASSQTLIKESTTSSNEYAWFTHKLIYQDTPLREVLDELELLHSIQISLSNPAMKDCPLSATFDNLSIDEILNRISLIFGLEIANEEPGKYTLTGEMACE